MEASPTTVPPVDRPLKARRNLILGLGLGSMILVVLFVTHGYGNTWRLWNIPVAWPPFMDLRVLTAGAEARRQGLDPMVSNPTDSSHRPLNYPRIWQALYRLGVGPAQTVPLGVVLMVLFGIGVCVFIPRISHTGVALVLAAVFSPAVMLGLERGNTDLLMFFLLALAVAWSRRGSVLPVLAVLFGFVLKLFPILGLVVVLGKRRAVAAGWLAVGLVFAALYVWFSFDDLQRISAATPRDTWLSYGLNVLWMKIAAQDPSNETLVRMASYGLAIGTLAWAGLAWWESRDEPAESEGPDCNAFRVGAACYVGTFLLGNNFIYRLMFLIFTIPQLWAWARGGSRHRAWAARVALAAMYVALWSLLIDRVASAWPSGPQASFFLSAGCGWMLYCTLVHLLVSASPAWMAQTARQWFPVEATAGGDAAPEP